MSGEEKLKAKSKKMFGVFFGEEHKRKYHKVILLNDALTVCKEEIDNYELALAEVSKVYCELTNNKLSKPNYKAEVILDEIRLQQQEDIDASIKDAIEKNNFCGDCRYLSVTEKEQTDKKEDHYCKIFKERVLHLGKHPLLPRLEKCKAIGTELEK